MKKKHLSYFILIMASILGFLAIYFKKNENIIQINSKEVSNEEFLYFMNKEMHSVSQRLSKNDKNIDSEFWSKEIDGKILYKELAKETIQSIKKFRAIYENAKEQGYVDNVDFESLKNRMSVENLSRLDRIKKGERVYGLSEFSLESYLAYETDSFEKKYLEDTKNEINISQKDILEYYEKNKDIFFKKVDDLKLGFIKVRKEDLSIEKLNSIKIELQKAYKHLEDGNSLKSFVKNSKILKEYFSEEEINSGNYSPMSKNIGDVLELAKNLKESEYTKVIEENETLYLIECLYIKDRGYFSIEESKNYIEKELKEKEYKKLIKSRVENSRIKVDENKLYNLIKRELNI